MRCIPSTGRSPRLATWRKQYPALRAGRSWCGAVEGPGLFAVSRIGSDGREILLAFNTSNTAITAQVEIEASTRSFTFLHGECPTPSAPGSVKIQLPAFRFRGLRGVAPEARLAAVRRVLLALPKASCPATPQARAPRWWRSPDSSLRSRCASMATGGPNTASAARTRDRRLVAPGFILADAPSWSAISDRRCGAAQLR
jgi:hypothetical protein